MPPRLIQWPEAILFVKGLRRFINRIYNDSSSRNAVCVTAGRSEGMKQQFLAPSFAVLLLVHGQSRQKNSRNRIARQAGIFGILLKINGGRRQRVVTPDAHLAGFHENISAANVLILVLPSRLG